jgi:hypothetical protein
MSIKELSHPLGREGLLETNGLKVAVRIMDVKQAYGRVRYVVTPLHGHGTATVEDFRVELVEVTG